jgi:hypothetical protein
MSSQSSRKIIIAAGMAVLGGIGIVAFALRLHSHASVAQVSPAAAVPAQVADVPAPVAQIPDIPTSVASASDAAIPAAVEPKVAVAAIRHPAKARSNVGTTHSTLTRSGSAIGSSEKPAGETLVNSVDVKSTDEPMMQPAASHTAADGQDVAISTEPTAPEAGSVPR